MPAYMHVWLYLAYEESSSFYIWSESSSPPFLFPFPSFSPSIFFILIFPSFPSPSLPSFFSSFSSPSSRHVSTKVDPRPLSRWKFVFQNSILKYKSLVKGKDITESIRMAEDRDKWRKYVHVVANRRIDDDKGTWNRNSQSPTLYYFTIHNVYFVYFAKFTFEIRANCTHGSHVICLSNRISRQKFHVWNGLNSSITLG